PEVLPEETNRVADIPGLRGGLAVLHVVGVSPFQASLGQLIDREIRGSSAPLDPRGLDPLRGDSLPTTGQPFGDDLVIPGLALRRAVPAAVDVPAIEANDAATTGLVVDQLRDLGRVAMIRHHARTRFLSQLTEVARGIRPCGVASAGSQTLRFQGFP